jgi:hypothetical protein
MQDFPVEVREAFRALIKENLSSTIEIEIQIEASGKLLAMTAEMAKGYQPTRW